MSGDPSDPLPLPLQSEAGHSAQIKVIGVGGGGNNAVNHMIAAGVSGITFIAANTDIQALRASKAEIRLQLGTQLTCGLGAGANAVIGRRAAIEDAEKIVASLKGADLVFITAGLGGGTGTGAAPVIASLAHKLNALTIAIVTMPFAFEGKRRMSQAEAGVRELLDIVDTVIIIPNEKLLAVAKDASISESFQLADDVLKHAVQCIADLITIPGIINRDLADIRTTIARMGYAVMGTASRSGPSRARDAAIAAMSSPLLETSAIDGAGVILINISGSSSLRLSEVNEASTIIQEAADETANILFGAVLDERLGDAVKITVIASGFHHDHFHRQEQPLPTVSASYQPEIIPQAVTSPALRWEDLIVQETQPVPQSIEENEPPPFETITQHEFLKLEQVDQHLSNLQHPQPVEHISISDSASTSPTVTEAKSHNASPIHEAAIAAYAAAATLDSEDSTIDEPKSFAEILERRIDTLDTSFESSIAEIDEIDSPSEQ